MKLIAVPFALFRFLFIVLLLVACAQGPALREKEKSADPDAVSFRSSEGNVLGGALTLTGRLKKPEGDGPFPAIVLLHGCGGIQANRDHRWAERLAGWGYVTLQADSFRPRGLSNVCTYSGRDSTDILQKRVTDAYDAKRYLAGLPFVDRSRVAVMGWSHGGSTTLETLYLKTDGSVSRRHRLLPLMQADADRPQRAAYDPDRRGRRLDPRRAVPGDDAEAGCVRSHSKSLPRRLPCFRWIGKGQGCQRIEGRRPPSGIPAGGGGGRHRPGQGLFRKH